MTFEMNGKSENVTLTQDQNDTVSKDTLQKDLQMKRDELTRLNRELIQCRLQRDQFKLMVEQMQERVLYLKRQINDTRDSKGCYNLDDHFKMLDLLTETREQNKCLKLQVETLRQKLGDAEADVKALRTNGNQSYVEDVQYASTIHQREEMIEQLERLNVKCSQLQTDLQTVVDEKQELQTERDVFKCKAHRLNHELSRALSATTQIDLDALISENRYLQERIRQLLEEKELARQSLSKYKSMLDRERVKESMKWGTNAAIGSIMTSKQAEQWLYQDSSVSPEKSATAINDLRCLCKALIEALNDKTLALAHQKKANKILALRICELDSVTQSPTTTLLEGYTSVDTKGDQDFTKLTHMSENSVENMVEHNVSTSNDDRGVSTVATENQITQQLYSVQMNLPKSLGLLVQKAMNNLRESDRKKS
ncbi:coiled-coil domain-containing protein 149 isoform X1 [Megachile rotundata]|uniref:coiled-coil domain-containing protein 149 isoform X1 n=1 Tax=Megachile rotundata TaxID=143995 RepID=UPI000614E8E8|nr:PREDICTED: coiled-coil domain-containing protein 149 isoform X1 [Megachile rotundata]